MQMLKCKDATRLVSQGLERPLGFRERWALRLHLWICDNCRRFERQMRLLRQALGYLARRMETQSQGPDLSPAARERIRKALAERDTHSH